MVLRNRSHTGKYPDKGDQDGLKGNSRAFRKTLPPPRGPLQGESLSFDPEVSLRVERTQCEAGPKGRVNPLSRGTESVPPLIRGG